MWLLLQDLTNALLDNKWKSNKHESKESLDDADAYTTLQEQDVGSGIVRIRAGAAQSLGVFSKTFVDWINEGQMLCY
jgi:hypothetical protein